MLLTVTCLCNKKESIIIILSKFCSSMLCIKSVDLAQILLHLGAQTNLLVLVFFFAKEKPTLFVECNNNFAVLDPPMQGWDRQDIYILNWKTYREDLKCMGIVDKIIKHNFDPSGPTIYLSGYTQLLRHLPVFKTRSHVCSMRSANINWQ